MLNNIKIGLGDYLKVNIAAYFAVVLIFLIGIALGAMAIKILPESQKLELVQYLNIFFSEFATKAQGNTEIFFTALWGNLKIILLLWVLGFTIIGIPFVLFIVFTRGFIIGFTVGFLLNEYVFKGLLFAITSILPHNLIMIPLIAFVAVTATNFSIRLIRRKNLIGGKLFSDSINYSILCLGAGVVMIAASLIEVYISPVFMRLATSFL